MILEAQGRIWAAAAVLAMGLATAGSANAITLEVNTIANASAPMVWYANDVRPGGTASIELLGGMGNLQTNQPLPGGAAKLTTDFTNAAKAEIAVADNYGLVRNIFSSLNVGYSYFKGPNGPGINAAAAPSLKLAFFSSAFVGDGFVQLVYEPTWNQSGSEGSSVNVPTGDWANVSIDEDSGLFWGTGGFGEMNSFGGPPLRTLAGWLTAFDAGFLDATLVGVSIGVGSFNQGQVGYFDNVRINHTSGQGYDKTYDFEAASVPEPASLAIFGLGLVGLGVYRRRRSV